MLETCGFTYNVVSCVFKTGRHSTTKSNSQGWEDTARGGDLIWQSHPCDHRASPDNCVYQFKYFCSEMRDHWIYPLSKFLFTLFFLCGVYERGVTQPGHSLCLLNHSSTEGLGRLQVIQGELLARPCHKWMLKLLKLEAVTFLAFWQLSKCLKTCHFQRF